MENPNLNMTAEASDDKDKTKTNVEVQDQNEENATEELSEIVPGKTYKCNVENFPLDIQKGDVIRISKSKGKFIVDKIDSTGNKIDGWKSKTLGKARFEDFKKSFEMIQEGVEDEKGAEAEKEQENKEVDWQKVEDSLKYLSESKEYNELLEEINKTNNLLTGKNLDLALELVKTHGIEASDKNIKEFLELRLNTFKKAVEDRKIKGITEDKDIKIKEIAKQGGPDDVKQFEDATKNIIPEAKGNAFFAQNVENFRSLLDESNDHDARFIFNIFKDELEKIGIDEKKWGDKEYVYNISINADKKSGMSRIELRKKTGEKGSQEVFMSATVDTNTGDIIFNAKAEPIESKSDTEKEKWDVVSRHYGELVKNDYINRFEKQGLKDEERNEMLLVLKDLENNFNDDMLVSFGLEKNETNRNRAFEMQKNVCRELLNKYDIAPKNEQKDKMEKEKWDAVTSDIDDISNKHYTERISLVTANMTNEDFMRFLDEEKRTIEDLKTHTTILNEMLSKRGIEVNDGNISKITELLVKKGDNIIKAFKFKYEELTKDIPKNLPKPGTFGPRLLRGKPIDELNAHLNTIKEYIEDLHKRKNTGEDVENEIDEFEKKYLPELEEILREKTPGTEPAKPDMNIAVDNMDLQTVEAELKKTDDYLEYIKTHKRSESWFSDELNKYGLRQQKMNERLAALRTSTQSSAPFSRLNQILNTTEQPMSAEDIQNLKDEIQRIEDEAAARDIDLSENDEYLNLKKKLREAQTGSGVVETRASESREQLYNKYENLSLKQEEQFERTAEKLSAISEEKKDLVEKKRAGEKLNETESKEASKIVTLRELMTSLRLDVLATESAKVMQKGSARERIDESIAVNKQLKNIKESIEIDIKRLEKEIKAIELDKTRTSASVSLSGAIMNSVKNIFKKGPEKVQERDPELSFVGPEVIVKRNDGSMERGWTPKKMKGKDRIEVVKIVDGKKVASKVVGKGELISWQSVQLPPESPAVQEVSPQPPSAESNAASAANAIRRPAEAISTAGVANAVETAPSATPESQPIKKNAFRRLWSYLTEDEPEEIESSITQLNTEVANIRVDDIVSAEDLKSSRDILIKMKELTLKRNFPSSIRKSLKSIFELQSLGYFSSIGTNAIDSNKLTRFVTNDKAKINALPDNMNAIKAKMIALVEKCGTLSNAPATADNDAEMESMILKHNPLSPSKLTKEIESLNKSDQLKLKKRIDKLNDPKEITNRKIKVSEIAATSAEFDNLIGNLTKIKFDDVKNMEISEFSEKLKETYDKAVKK